MEAGGKLGVDDRHFDTLTRTIGRRTLTVLGAGGLAMALGLTAAAADSRKHRKKRKNKKKDKPRLSPGAPCDRNGNQCSPGECFCTFQSSANWLDFETCLCRAPIGSCKPAKALCERTEECCEGLCRPVREGVMPTCTEAVCLMGTDYPGCSSDEFCCDGPCGFTAYGATPNCRSHTCVDTGQRCEDTNDCCTGSCAGGTCIEPTFP